jgi:RNA ligase (TIGR02306 family)
MTENLTDIESTEIVDRNNLATLQVIKEFVPIAGKDFIQLATFENCGFKAVVQKEIHSIGDLVLVVKYDTVLPQLEMFEFMRDSKFRVKTKSFSSDHGKLFSQCIVLPLSAVEDHLGINEFPYEEGEDLTEALGVKKYIAPVRGTGSSFGKMSAKTTFPTHLLSKTDEMNCQSKPATLQELQGLAYSITCKLDGSSMTCLINPENNEFEVCSRNTTLRFDESNSFWIIAQQYDIENILRNALAAGKNYGIQMELVGPKIQGNKMCLETLDGFVFNIIDLDSRKRISFEEQFSFCLDNNLKHVPVIETGISFDLELDYLLDFASNMSYDMYGFKGAKNPIEGLVIRPTVDTWSRVLKDTLSVKVMNPLFK